MIRAQKNTGYIRLVIIFLVLQSISTAIVSAVVLGHLVHIHVVQLIIPLVLAGLLGLGYRWAAIAAALYGGFAAAATGVGLYRNFSHHEHLLYNPAIEASDPFSGANIGQMLIMLGVFVMSLADIRLRNRDDIRVPGAASYLLAGFVIGSLSLGLTIALLVQVNWISGVSGKAVSALPVFEMKPDGIVPETFQMRTGESAALYVANYSGNSCHILEFPELDARVHVEEGRGGLLVIRPEQPGTYVYQCRQHHSYMNERIQGRLTVIQSDE